MKSLARRFPKIAAAFELAGLARLPTPLDRATSMGAALGLDRLLIKRDDLSGELYGGNKIRKLDLVLADARRRGCDAVLTFGAVGSNHVMATAICARALGLECYAVLTAQPPSPEVRNKLLHHAELGTRLLPVDGYADALAAAERARAEHPTGPGRVYRIPWGGSSWLGTVGFVDAGFELAEQCESAVAPDNLYVACGTMGSAVGLAIGLRVAGLTTRVVTVKVVPSPVTSERRFAELFGECIAELRAVDETFPALEDPFANVEVRHGFLGPGYAEPTPECLEAIDLLASSENIQLEATYTGKALAALVSDARAGLLANRSVVFWNTYNGNLAPAESSGASLPPALQRYLAA